MTQKDYNLLAGQQYDTTYNAAMEVEQENLITQKAKKLAERTQEKLNKIGTYKQDTLLGMSDADTVTTENVGYAREVDPYGNRYDAVELRHGDNPYDMQGISKEARDAGQFGKSTYAMQKQRELVASVFNKPVEEVTEQDMLDVANQQQIQKLADLARAPGEERWEAPLIRNSVQTNLTGTYVDASGNEVNLPLNVPILSKDVGPIGERGGIALGNTYGEEVTANAALDKTQNAFAGNAVTQKTTPIDYEQIAQQINKAGDPDNMTGESLDIAQSSLIQQYAGTVDALNTGVRALATKFGVDEKTVDEWIPKDVKIGLIEGGYTAKELAQPELADKIAGVKVETIEEQQKAMESAKENLKKGEYLGATADVISVIPYMLGDSAGEITALALGTPGLVSAIGNRVNKDMETYKQTNNVDEVDSAWLLGSTILNTAALVSEKFLLKTGINGVIQKGVSKAGRAGAVLESMVGEAAQEAFDQTQQTYMTQKEGDKTLGEIVGSADTGLAALSGGVLGGTLRGAGEAVSATKDAIPGVIDATKRGVELATETPEQKEIREAKEYSEPIKEEVINSILAGDSSTVADRAEKIHGKMVDTLDASADKSVTYSILVKDALKKATDSGNQQEIDNVFKTIADLDKDPKVEFNATDLVDETVYQTTQEFIKLINKGVDATDMQGKVTEDILNKAEERESILKEVEALKSAVSAAKERYKSVLGSDAMVGSIKELEALETKIDEYLKGKDLTAVNNEFAELGFITGGDDTTLVADPNRPGLKVYERELKNQLLNTKTNKNLLNDKVLKGAKVKLTGLTNFADSRLRKLDKGKYQTKGLIESLLNENEQMLNTVNNTIQVVKGLKSINDATKKAYEAELMKAAKSALAANKELARRKAVLDDIKEDGTYTFKVEKDGTETIHKVTGKSTDGKYTTTKVADVVDNKAIMKKSKVSVEPEEVISKEEYYNKAKVDEVKELIKEKAGKPELLTKEDEQLLANASEDGTLKQANKELAEEVQYSGPLAEVRAKVDSIDKELSNLLKTVPDMEVKNAVKEHYTKKLNELKTDRNKLDKLINRLESVLDKRLERKYGESTNLLKGIVGQIDKLVKAMLNQINRLRKMVKSVTQKYNKVNNELNELMEMINKVEKDYTSKPTKMTVGSVKVIDEKLYGKPVVEVNGVRKEAPKRISEKTGKEVAQSTAINDFLETVKENRIVELRDELKDMPKGKTSLGAKLLGRLLLNFPMNSSVHKIVKRVDDSVFGQLVGNPFKDTNKLLDVLPESFKEFFASDTESRETLKENIKVMANYLDTTKISEIKLGENNLVNNIDNNGLAIKNINKYVPIERELKKGDKLIDNTKQTYIVEEVIGKLISVRTTGKNSIKTTKTVSDFTGVLEKQEKSVPVNILELIGTPKDGVLQIDEQTKNILKFYSAKMLSDAHTMVGKILSFDESEMSQYLGITDPDEQMQVKADARRGYVSSASIRKDIGSEVYQALGIRFNETTPEFTAESFKSALGVLVQAIAIDNGTMSMEKSEIADKNQNLVKVNWENVGVDKDGLMKSINKLQYMNESRNRPLPSLRVPADNNNRKVMNSENAMDKKSTDFLNKQEKIAYTISDDLKMWLEMDEKDALKAMGYIEVENAGLHVSEIDAQIARNDKLVREWEILKVFAKAVGNKEFYLKWGQTVSGRYTILNDIQYQESKLHREFVVANGSVETVDPTNENDVQALKASIMQGLDMDPDKLSSETANKNFDAMFKVTKNGIEVAKDGVIKNAYEALKNTGKVDVEAMSEVFNDSEGHHGLSSIRLLVKWDKAIKENATFQTHANLEIDAITSGMILTLLQIGSDQALKLAEKGGIYTAEGKEKREAYVKKWLGDKVVFTPGALIEAGKKHAAEIESKMKTAKGTELAELRNELENDEVFKDLYSTIGVAMIGEVQAYKEKLINKLDKNEDEDKQLAMLEQIGELNLKNIRSIAKSPVMVYIYGATTNSIKKKLTYSLGVDTLVKAIKTASKKLKKGENADTELAFIKKFIPEEKYVDWLGNKIETPKERWEQLLAVDITNAVEDIDKVIRATFGTAIENAFESRLGFVDRNRDVAKSIEMLVFEAYQIRLSDEVSKMLNERYGIGKHNGETYKLSKEDLQSINEKLTTQGYGHNIVWYEDGNIVNQSLNKTGDKGSIHSVSVEVGNTKVGGQVKQSKPVVNTGAAPTISIHAIDGRMMLDVLNRNLDGKYAGGNVYDAVVLSINKAMLEDTANSYNTNMIETGFKRSIIADQLTMLENMLSSMSNDQKVRMLNNIGLRPEGELREDYTKETNRLKLSIGKMLERIELAEQVNKERVANSAKEYYSGHLFQMGSGVVKIDSSTTRAKEFPEITSVKALLTKRLEKDRVMTYNDFAKAGIKLNKQANYVLNVEDIINGETQVESKANIVQMAEDKVVRGTDLSKSLSSKDTVEIVGEFKQPEKPNKQSRLYDRLIEAIENSGASIVSNGRLVKETKSENTNLKTYTVYPKAKPDMVKAKYKASKATKYIGYGKAGSSTELYAKQLSEQGMLVNSGEYNTDDVVFVSINGKGKLTPKLLKQTVEEVTKALEMGATILTDSEEYISKSEYNIGEKKLAEALLQKGYIRKTNKDNNLVGVWVKPKNEVVKEQTKQQGNVQNSIKEINTQTKLEQLLEVYSTDTDPKIGGGLIENVTEEVVINEDLAKATMEKGIQEESLKGMLPKIDGRKLGKYKKAINAWYNENKRGSVIRETLNELLDVLNTVEQEPILVEEFGWGTVAPKQENSIIYTNDILEAVKECAKG